MLAYSVITLSIGIICLVFAVFIHRGKTSLIHDYHRTNVKLEDKDAYGRAFSKGVFGIAGSLVTSGIVALFGEDRQFVGIAVIVLFVGIAISFAIIVRAQKKFNGGLF